MTQHTVPAALSFWEVRVGASAAGRLVIQWCEAVDGSQPGKSLDMAGVVVQCVLPALLLEVPLPKGVNVHETDFVIKKPPRHRVGCISLCRKGVGGPDIAAATGLQVCLASAPFLDGHHVAIGEVVDGFDVLERIEKVGSLPLGRCSEEVKITRCGEVVEED